MTSCLTSLLVFAFFWKGKSPCPFFVNIFCVVRGRGGKWQTLCISNLAGTKKGKVEGEERKVWKLWRLVRLTRRIPGNAKLSTVNDRNICVRYSQERVNENARVPQYLTARLHLYDADWGFRYVRVWNLPEREFLMKVRVSFSWLMIAKYLQVLEMMCSAARSWKTASSLSVLLRFSTEG